MTASEFDAALASALRLCQLAADLRLPIEEMLEHIQERLESVLPAAPEMLRPDEEDQEAMELEALRELLGPVREVAAIGASLSGAARRTEAPALSCPLPGNLRRAGE